MYFTVVVFVTIFIVTNKIWVFIRVAAAKAQSVRRLVTEWKIRGSNLSGGKINTTILRPYVLLCLNNVRILPGRTKLIEVAFYTRNAP